MYNPIISTRTVYLISGPLGVGKTSVSKKVHILLDNSALIEGDLFFHEFDNQGDLAWEEKLKKSWQKILSKTESHLKNGLDVVVDFVVEDELKWFYQKLADYNVTLKYVVLVTDKDIIASRLTTRKEIQYLDRSLLLLEKITKNRENEKYFYDTSNKDVPDIAKELIASSQFEVKNL